MRHQNATDTLAAERYLLNEMTEQERYEFEAHYFECAECADLVRAGAAMAAGARSLRGSREVAPGPAPALAVRRRSGAMTLLPFAAAAALALVAGYQALVTIPSLREGVSPRAVRPVALAPASRGDAAVIPLASARDGVTLMVDVNAGPGDSRVTFQLTGPSDTLSSSADTPAPGLPLVIWLPPHYLTAGDYQLAVRSATPPNRDLGEYRFTVR